MVQPEKSNEELLHLGACYGRYRGWKSILKEGEEYSNDKALIVQFEATALEDIRVGFAPSFTHPDSDSPEADATEEEQAQEQANTEEANTTVVSEEQPPEDPVSAAITTEVTYGNEEEDEDAMETSTTTKKPQKKQRVFRHWVYELVAGSSANTEALWRKCLAPRHAHQSPKEIEIATAFTGRLCSTQDYIKYWIIIQNGSLLFGVGPVIGQDTVLKVKDEHFVPVVQISFTTWKSPVTYRNISYHFVQEDVNKLDQMEPPRLIVRGDPYGEKDLLTPRQRQEYLTACETSKKRAERFGQVFVPPDVKKFLDSKEIRRLQRTGVVSAGFVTGFDLTSQEEMSKREQRMKRFHTPAFFVNDFSTETIRAMQQGLTQEEWQEIQMKKEKLAQRAKKFGLEENTTMIQSNHQQDLRMNLHAASSKVDQERKDVEQQQEINPMIIDFRDDAIHMYSLDASFLQVRTGDILQYFAGYGPSYVEWINDSSCTIVFQDRFTAARALISLAQEIPTQMIKKKKNKAKEKKTTEGETMDETEDVNMEDDEPTATTVSQEEQTKGVVKEEDEEEEEEEEEEDTQEENVSFNRSQWRYGLPISSQSQGESKKWRVLLRKATDDDFPAEKTDKKYYKAPPPPRHRLGGHRNKNRRHHPYSEGGGGGGGGHRHNKRSHSGTDRYGRDKRSRRDD